jgi:hypothetical protein
MPKSMSELGTIDLTINELRLLGGTFTTLNSTDLFVTGTAQIGNVVTGGAFNVGQLTADAVTIPELIATGTITIKALNDTTAADNKIAFIQGGTNTGILKTSTNLYYNPSNSTFTTGAFNGNMTGDVTGNVTATNIATTNITAPGNTSTTALNNTTSNYNNCVPFIDGNTPVNETGMLKSRGNFSYNCQSEALSAGTFNGALNGSVSNAASIVTQNLSADAITAPSLRVDGAVTADNAFMSVDATDGLIVSQVSGCVFKTGTNNRLKIETSQTRIFNNLQCDGTATFNNLTAGNLEAMGNTTTTAINAEATSPFPNANCRVLHLEGNTLTGSLSGGGVFYNPNGEVLFADKIQGTNHSHSPQFLVQHTGVGNGIISQLSHADGVACQRYEQENGHLFRN